MEQTAIMRPVRLLGAAAIARGTARLCFRLGWAVLREVSLANGRRADLLALAEDGSFIAIEVKSCARDFLADGKWHEYRAFSDQCFLAVDADFPQELLPEDVGLIVADAYDATLLRPAPRHPMAPARRRALTQRFARLAARRTEAWLDPEGQVSASL
jgi:hypothetical protein